MSEEITISSLRDRVARIEGALANAAGEEAADRDALRGEIVAIFRDTEHLIEELNGIKVAIPALVERFKETFPKAAPPAGPARVDHLGSSTYRERGWSALAGGDDERAIRELRRALELAPGEPSSAILLAWALGRSGQLAEAIEMVAAVLAADPESTRGRLVAGYLYMREARFAEAIEHLAPVARSGTDRTAALYGNLYLGMLYSDREMYRDAQPFFLRALELGPNLTEAYWELGRSHFNEGRPDLAMEAWRAGGSNRFNLWGERCRDAAERLAAAGGAPSG
jgi:tetratricopeptide (TPR) repeat protein